MLPTKIQEAHLTSSGEHCNVGSSSNKRITTALHLVAKFQSNATQCYPCSQTRLGPKCRGSICHAAQSVMRAHKLISKSNPKYLVHTAYCTVHAVYMCSSAVVEKIWLTAPVVGMLLTPSLHPEKSYLWSCMCMDNHQYTHYNN